MLGVTPIGLDPIPRPARNLRRCCDHALHTTPRELARKPVPRRAGLIRGPRRTRQPRAKPGRRHRLTAHRKPESSPVSTSNTAATIFVACTSKPTTVLAFAMAGSSYAIVGRRAGTSRAARTSPHEQHRGTSPFYTSGRTRPVNPYCLGEPGQQVGMSLLPPVRRLAVGQVARTPVATRLRVRAHRPSPHLGRERRSRPAGPGQTGFGCGS